MSEEQNNFGLAHIHEKDECHQRSMASCIYNPTFKQQLKFTSENTLQYNT